MYLKDENKVKRGRDGQFKKVSFQKTFNLKEKTINSFLNGPTPAFFVYFNNKSMWKNVHSVYGARIRTHEISNMSHHP